MQFHIILEKDRGKQETGQIERETEKQQHGDLTFNLFVDVNLNVYKWLTLFICVCVCVYVLVLMHCMYSIGNYTKITSQRVSLAR